MSAKMAFSSLNVTLFFCNSMICVRKTGSFLNVKILFEGPNNKLMLFQRKNGLLHLKCSQTFCAKSNNKMCFLSVKLAYYFMSCLNYL